MDFQKFIFSFTLLDKLFYMDGIGAIYRINIPIQSKIMKLIAHSDHRQIFFIKCRVYLCLDECPIKNCRINGNLRHKSLLIDIPAY
ncbi:MAG: hypothetical protein IPN10_12445 [Saprospiraceae bacterium]|nr:hypothetical protein [Saprospiraceae bacterium]